MPAITVPIAISTEQWMDYYRGAVQSVRAYTLDGRSVQLPARVFQPFLTPEGIRGVFRVHFDENHRFVRIERLDKATNRSSTRA